MRIQVNYLYIEVGKTVKPFTSNWKYGFFYKKKIIKIWIIILKKNYFHALIYHKTNTFFKVLGPLSFQNHVYNNV